MFKQKPQQGFTLIELLVVIAIIGILAATVLAALGTARSSGSNASAIGSMSSMRAQAEIFYNTSNTYAGVCTSMATLTTAARANGSAGTGAATWLNFTYVGSAGGNASAWSTTAASNQGVCHDSANAWAASVPLTGVTPGTYACVDSTGASKVTATALSALNAGGTVGLVCP